jgi:hypothetical protein
MTLPFGGIGLIREQVEFHVPDPPFGVEDAKTDSTTARTTCEKAGPESRRGFCPLQILRGLPRSGYAETARPTRCSRHRSPVFRVKCVFRPILNAGSGRT